jgi:phosphoribosyl-AMP cyclohydrolase
VSTRQGTRVEASEEELARVRFGPDGLVVAVVQEASTREVLMVGYMDREALTRSLSTGRSWFFSRSRGEYWCKGETSGNRQWVRRVSYDCDGDALLVEVDQEGRGACHTGERTCFYRAFGGSADVG